MSTAEGIEFGISLAVGLLSLGLGVFAIWLSLRLSRSSTEALDSVRDLSNETRTLVQSSLDHQRGFSSKMLDSILEQNKFGRARGGADAGGAGELAAIVRQQLQDTERKIVSSVEHTVKQLARAGDIDESRLQSALQIIRGDIEKVAATASQAYEAMALPEDLKAGLVRFRNYPAHYLVLQAIADSGASTNAELAKQQSRFRFPKGWEGGLQNLVQAGILEEDGAGFRIPERYLAALRLWIERNRVLLRRLADKTSADNAGSVTPEESAIGHSMAF